LAGNKKKTIRRGEVVHMDQYGANAIWIESLIKDFIETSPENTLKNQNNDKAFEMPLVGF